MKSLIVKCRKYNCINIFLYHICVYNNENKLIFKGHTDNMGNIKIDFPCFGVYKVIIFDLNNCKKNCIIIFVNEKLPSELLVINDIKKTICKVILLTDKNYKNLPIMKGELIVCKNM